MAGEALSAAVIQKLTNFFIDDSTAFDNVIEQIEEIRVRLRGMSGFLLDAEGRNNDDDATKWATDYFRLLFSTEDVVENYVLSLSACGTRGLGFFQRYGVTLSGGPGRSLRRKFKSLAAETKNLEKTRPTRVVDELSLRPRRADSGEEEENELPAHEKLCLQYMALIPKEVEISVRRLHRLWLAEGFIRRSPGMSEEDAVEVCFYDLVRRRLIEVSKFKWDGSPKRCRLPVTLHESLYPKARQISLFHVHQEHQDAVFEDPKLGIRRVVECVNITNENITASASTSSRSYENLRSYLSFNPQRYDIPAKQVGGFIREIIEKKGFGALRVLDLEGVYKPTLPEEALKQLFHLRYLGLRWTFMDDLPESVGDLSYLETLDLKRTYINSLPFSIWKLKHLRHLNLPRIRLDYKQKKCPSYLTEVRTLVGFVEGIGY